MPKCVHGLSAAAPTSTSLAWNHLCHNLWCCENSLYKLALVAVCARAQISLRVGPAGVVGVAGQAGYCFKATLSTCCLRPYICEWHTSFMKNTNLQNKP